MASEQSHATTNDEVLDRMLGGGLPRGRAILLSGGPGAGKSTLGMQFLQAGLDAGEQVLFVSTEQTASEFRDSFSEFGFDIDDERFTFTSVHAVTGEVFGEETLTLGSVGGDGQADGTTGLSVPFEMEYIREHLSEYADVDRVIFDSVSGIAPLAEDTPEFRSNLLGLIQLFTADFDATAVFIAEESAKHTDIPAAELLQFTVHGALRVTRERVAGEYHRYLEVTKLRGVDHDTAPHEFEITLDGVKVLPRDDRNRLLQVETVSTGIPGLDTLTGGGYPLGNSAVLECDGRSSANATVASGVVTALDTGRAVVLFPPPNVTPEWVRERISSLNWTLRELLDEDRLFVIDWSSTWEIDHRNVFGVHLTGFFDIVAKWKPYLTQKLLRTYRALSQRRDVPLTAFVYTETMLQDFAPSDVRFQYNWARANILNDDDNVVFVHNPQSMGESLAQFYVHDAEQVLRQWVHDNGMEYIRLKKGTAGRTGVSRHVSPQEDPPFLEVRGSRPPE
jgi:KaiC/GvpD/RAD55 family RecA-like ATPase